MVFDDCLGNCQTVDQCFWFSISLVALAKNVSSALLNPAVVNASY